jgi:hypothetical protein
MIVAAVVTLILHRLTFSGNDAVVFAKTSLITAGCTTLAWVIATFITPAEPDDKLLSFYRRVHPTIYGWKKVASMAPEMAEVRDLGSNAFDWVMGCVMVYGTLFGIGKIVFGAWVAGLVLLACAALSGYLIFWDLSRRGWQTLSGVQQNTSMIAEMKSSSR